MTEYEEQAVARQVFNSMDRMSLKEALFRIERAVIVEALRLTQGNCDAAASWLGMNRTTLVEKRRRHALPLQSLPTPKAQGYTGKKSEGTA